MESSPANPELKGALAASARRAARESERSARTGIILRSCLLRDHCRHAFRPVLIAEPDYDLAVIVFLWIRFPAIVGSARLLAEVSRFDAAFGNFDVS